MAYVTVPVKIHKSTDGSVHEIVFTETNGNLYQLNCFPKSQIVNDYSVKVELISYDFVRRSVKVKIPCAGRNVIETRPLIYPGPQAPRVGLACVVWNKTHDRILMGLRSGIVFHGCWGMPGGHLDFGEDPIEGAIRETKEETGLIVVPTTQSPIFKPYLSAFHPESNCHYITLYVETEILEGEVQNLEPHKCEKWDWIDPYNPPENLVEEFPLLKPKKDGWYVEMPELPYPEPSTYYALHNFKEEILNGIKTKKEE